MERTGFAEREAGVEAILREYHEHVAERFERWLADRAVAPGDGAEGAGTDAGFSPEAYVEGELATDAAYLANPDVPRPLAVALDGDDGVGCVYLYRVSADVAEVKRLYVRDAHRGLGLGRDLASAVVALAADAGFSTLRLDTASFMRSAVGLYRDLGFEEVESGESVTDVPAALRDEITYMRMAVDRAGADDARGGDAQ